MSGTEPSPRELDVLESSLAGTSSSKEKNTTAPLESNELEIVQEVYVGSGEHEEKEAVGFIDELFAEGPRRKRSAACPNRRILKRIVSDTKEVLVSDVQLSYELKSEMIKRLFIKSDRLDYRLISVIDEVNQTFHIDSNNNDKYDSGQQRTASHFHSLPTMPSISLSFAAASINQNNRNNNAWIDALNELELFIMDEVNQIAKRVKKKKKLLQLRRHQFNRLAHVKSAMLSKNDENDDADESTLAKEKQSSPLFSLKSDDTSSSIAGDKDGLFQKSSLLKPKNERRKLFIGGENSWENKILNNCTDAMMDHLEGRSIDDLMNDFSQAHPKHGLVLHRVINEFRLISGLRRLNEKGSQLAFIHVFVRLIEWIICSEYSLDHYPMIHIPRTMKDIKRPQLSRFRRMTQPVVSLTRSLKIGSPHRLIQLKKRIAEAKGDDADDDDDDGEDEEAEEQVSLVDGSEKRRLSSDMDHVTKALQLLGVDEHGNDKDEGDDSKWDRSNSSAAMVSEVSVTADSPTSPSVWKGGSSLLIWADGFRLSGEKHKNGQQIRQHYGHSRNPSLSAPPSKLTLLIDEPESPNSSFIASTNRGCKQVKCEGCRKPIHLRSSHNGKNSPKYAVFFCRSADQYFVFHSRECVRLRKLKESMRVYIMHCTVWAKRQAQKNEDRANMLNDSNDPSASSSSSSLNDLNKRCDFAGFERGHAELSEDILKLLTMKDSMSFTEQRMVRPPTRRDAKTAKDGGTSVLSRNLSLAAFYKFEECEAMALNAAEKSPFWTTMGHKDHHNESSTRNTLTIAQKRRISYFEPRNSADDMANQSGPPKIPTLFRSMDFLTFGPSLWSFCIEQMQTKERPSVWRSLEFLAYVIPSNLCIKLLFKYIHELARMTQSTQKLDIICQIIVETAQFPMAAALMIAYFYRRRFEINDEDEDDGSGGSAESSGEDIVTSNTLNQKYVRIAQCFLERIESDQLIALILENPTNFEHMSICDIALKYHLDSFLSFNRLQPVIDHIWYNDVSLLDPSVGSFATETRLSNFDVWLRLVQKPAHFYFSPMGLYCISTLLYIGYLLFVSYMSYLCVYPYQHLIQVEIVFWYFNLGYGLYEMVQLHFMGTALYFTELINWFDMGIVLNWGLLFAMRWVLPNMLERRFFEAHRARVYLESEDLTYEIDCDNINNDNDNDNNNNNYDGLIDNPGYYCDAKSRNKPFNIAYMCLWSINLILLWMRLANYLQRNPKFGLLLRMISAMISDIFNFVVVATVLTVGFVLSMHFIISDDIDEDQVCNAESSLNTLPSQTLYIVQTLLAQQEWESINSNDCFNSNRSRAVTFFVLLYALLGSIMLLNLLIAMMASTYEVVRERAKLEVNYNLVKSTIESQTNTAVMPPPFNMIVVLVLIVFYLCRLMVYLGTLGNYTLTFGFGFPIHFTCDSDCKQSKNADKRRKQRKRSRLKSSSKNLSLNGNGGDSAGYKTLSFEEEAEESVVSSQDSLPAGLEYVMTQRQSRMDTVIEKDSSEDSEEDLRVSLDPSRRNDYSMASKIQSSMMSSRMMATSTTIMRDDTVSNDRVCLPQSCCYGWCTRATTCSDFCSGAGTAWTREGATICRHCRHNMNDSGPGNIDDYFSWFVRHQSLDESDKQRVKFLLKSTRVCNNCFRPFKYYLETTNHNNNGLLSSDDSSADLMAGNIVENVPFSNCFGRAWDSDDSDENITNNTHGVSNEDSDDDEQGNSQQTKPPLVNERYYPYQRNIEIVSFYVFMVFLYVPMIFVMSIPALVSWLVSKMSDTDAFTQATESSSSFDTGDYNIGAVDRDFQKQVENVLENCGCDDYADGESDEDKVGSPPPTGMISPQLSAMQDNLAGLIREVTSLPQKSDGINSSELDTNQVLSELVKEMRQLRRKVDDLTQLMDAKKDTSDQ